MAIYVTKTFLPPLEKYQKKVAEIFSSSILTNQGPNLLELEAKLKSYLCVDNFHFLTNGTLALQLALSSLDINEGEIITTPFSYVATISSIMWQRCQPVFVDIEPNNFTIDVEQIEKSITSNTKAIVAVHVFGYACNVERIEFIAKKYDLKVIYDGAHAFGGKYKGKSILDYGDVSTLSFHATKLFHTIEGGACITKNKEVSSKLDLQKRFGHRYDEHIMLGINAKGSELQAAMGLCNFEYIDYIIKERKLISELYDRELEGIIERPKIQENLEYNYSYYPVIFKSEKILLDIFQNLNKNEIFPRRYFYPSLNKLPYVNKAYCKISEDISSRIACLPIYVGLEKKDILKICQIIKDNINGR